MAVSNQGGIKMKATVDRELCIGCSYCISVCPEVFSTDADGKAEAAGEELSLELEKCAKEAATNCPVDAITVK
jgi:ferredoxin